MELKVQVKNGNGCEKTLAIDVASNVVTEEYQSFYQAVAKRAKVPGFRPGHAPVHVLKIHYQKEAHDEVLKHLVSRSFYEAVKKESLSLVGEPQIELVTFDESHLKFNAHVETKPKIKIDKYVGVTLERKLEMTGSDEVSDVLKRIQEAQAKYEPVEDRPAKLEDFLICDYTVKVDDKEAEKQENTWIQIREDEYLKGFSIQLSGVKAGESREVEVKFPADYARKELQSKSGRFYVQVKEVKAKMLPPLDDELAKTAGPFETLQALRDAISKDIEAHKGREADAKLEESLFEELLKRTKFDIPKKLLERRTEAVLHEMIESRMQRGLSQEQATKDLEELKKQAAVQAEKNIRISFILDEIATKEKMQISPEDVEAKYHVIAERVRRPVEEVKAFYQEHEHERESLQIQVLTEKTIQWLKSKATIKDIKLDQKGGSK